MKQLEIRSAQKVDMFVFLWNIIYWFTIQYLHFAYYGYSEPVLLLSNLFGTIQKSKLDIHLNITSSLSLTSCLNANRE